MQLFYRDGSEVTAEDMPRVHMGAQGVSGYITKTFPCYRCGGQGGSPAWKHTGYVCYRCGGKRPMSFEVRDIRVFTAEKLAKLQAAAEKKRLAKLAKAKAKAERERQEFIAWAKAGGQGRGILIGRILCTGKLHTHGFIYDLAGKLRNRWTLSPKQLEAAELALDRMDERKARDEASRWVGEIKERIDFEGEVEFEMTRDGYYGVTHIIKIRSTEGNVFTWFASGWQNLAKGDRVKVRGTVKKHDEYKGVKQTVLSRCKVEKFLVMTAEEVAEAGDLLTGERVQLIYPERRSVPASQIMTWHSDCVANGDLPEHTGELQAAIRDLEDLGYITVGR